MKTQLLTLIPFLLIMLTTGCQGYSITGGPGQSVPQSAQTESESPRAILNVHSVYAAPVTFEQNIDRSQALTEILTGIVRRDASKTLDLEIVPPESPEPEFRGTSTQAFLQDAQKYAHSLGAESVLITRVQQYVKRIGTAAAAERGAHVAFTMELRSAATGETVWKGSYSFKDVALTENFLRLGERVREEGRSGWWTAEALFERGSRDLLAKLQNDRIQQFTRK